MSISMASIRFVTLRILSELLHNRNVCLDISIRSYTVLISYLCKKNCSVYIQCKGDIVVVDIKQHKSQFKNSNFTITQSAKFF